jgi:hypothetical protein
VEAGAGSAIAAAAAMALVLSAAPPETVEEGEEADAEGEEWADGMGAH